jgi:hypothetical protein
VQRLKPGNRSEVLLVNCEAATGLFPLLHPTLVARWNPATITATARFVTALEQIAFGAADSRHNRRLTKDKIVCSIIRSNTRTPPERTRSIASAPLDWFAEVCCRLASPLGMTQDPSPRFSGLI